MINLVFHLQVVNQHLLKDLTDRGLWNEALKNDLIANNGSVQVCLQPFHAVQSTVTGCSFLIVNKLGCCISFVHVISVCDMGLCSAE